MNIEITNKGDYYEAEGFVHSKELYSGVSISFFGFGKTISAALTNLEESSVPYLKEWGIRKGHPRELFGKWPRTDFKLNQQPTKKPRIQSKGGLWDSPVVEKDKSWDRYVEKVAIQSKKTFKRASTADVEALPLLKKQKEMF